MKISGTRTQIVELPADEPLAGAADNPNGKRPIVTLRVETDGGAEGIGVSYFGGALTRTLAHAIDELGALIVGEDPVRVEAVQAKLKNAAGGSAGPGGVYNLALSALDIALWDIRAKSVELPLWKLLRGWREMKTQMALPGHTTPAIEVDRMKRIREAIGPDIKLMCDINQRWRPEQ